MTGSQDDRYRNTKGRQMGGNKWVTGNLRQRKLLRGWVLLNIFSNAGLPSRIVWEGVIPGLLEHRNAAEGLGL